jgi:type 1 glutamine amidotransferase
MEGRKHILFLGGSQYYAHDAVSKAMYTIARLGADSGLWDVMFRTDFRLVSRKPLDHYRNAKNLNYFDAIMLFTQGEFRLTDDQKVDLLSFVREDGKGLLVAHSGTDFNRWEFTSPTTMVIKDDGGWPDLTKLIGGVFVSHPWRQKVKVNVEDRDFPATRHFPKTLEIEDEIYQMGQYSRDQVRVLMSLDVSSVDLKHPPLAPVVRTDLDFPLVWAKTEGKGRVFVSPLGHIMSHWDRADMQKMWLEAARWVLKLSQGDATPLGSKRANP